MSDINNEARFCVLWCLFRLWQKRIHSALQKWSVREKLRDVPSLKASGTRDSPGRFLDVLGTHSSGW